MPSDCTRSWKRNQLLSNIPKRRQSGLNADHHTICKFQHREDHNYLIVRNTLRLWVVRLKAKDEAGRSSFFLLSLYAFWFDRCSGDAGRRPSV